MAFVPLRIYMVSGACHESTLDIELYLLTSHLLICAKNNNMPVPTLILRVNYVTWEMSLHVEYNLFTDRQEIMLQE